LSATATARSDVGLFAFGLGAFTTKLSNSISVVALKMGWPVCIVHTDDFSGVGSVNESQLLEESVAIAWVYLQRSGELGDGCVAARFLTDEVDAMIRRGRRNRMFLATWRSSSTAIRDARSSRP
jgi:hypothetical protein